jgi:hypothetical protein
MPPIEQEKPMQFFEKTLGQLLEEKTKAHPDKDFMVFSDRNLRFT